MFDLLIIHGILNNNNLKGDIMLDNVKAGASFH